MPSDRLYPDIPWWSLLPVAYILSGILAFGHCASRVVIKEDLRFSTPQEQRAMHGFFAAIANPLYWAWVLFEKPAPTPERVEK